MIADRIFRDYQMKASRKKLFPGTRGAESYKKADAQCKRDILSNQLSTKKNKIEDYQKKDLIERHSFISEYGLFGVDSINKGATSFLQAFFLQASSRPLPARLSCLLQPARQLLRQARQP